MHIGLVVDGTDHFLRPIESALRESHAVERFSPRFVRLPLIGKRVNDQLLRWQLIRFMKRNDVTFFEWVGDLAVLASHLPKCGRIVMRLHSVELAVSASKVAWENVDRLIMLNQTLARHFHKIVQGATPEITLISNGVNLKRFVYEPRSFNYHLGMVANLRPIKRIYEVILGLYALRQSGYPFELYVAGKPILGEDMRYAWSLESLVAKLGLSSHVFFEGYVSDISDWLHKIDVFISNSYWEGQQVALLEAMASGCYCLSHCWDGVEEILPSEQIFTTDSDLRAKLLAYAALSEEEQRQAQARMRAIAEEKFDERRMVREMIAVIETAGGK